MHILVVEDEKVLCETIVRSLRRLDYSVDSCYDGNEAIELLHLKKIQAVHGRAEDLARKPEFRGKFDLCVSRAVANMNTLSEYCIPFVRVNGFFISYKAQKGLEEIHESDHCMKELGSKIMQVDEFKLTDIDSNRVLIKIKKCKGTSKLYPRKAGIPSKNPL